MECLSHCLDNVQINNKKMTKEQNTQFMRACLRLLHLLLGPKPTIKANLKKKESVTRTESVLAIVLIFFNPINLCSD